MRILYTGALKPGSLTLSRLSAVRALGHDVEQVGCELLARLLTSGGELVTVVTGADAPEGLADRIAAWVEQAHPAVEVLAYDGGQQHYPLLLGVE